eukprot:SAG22_NODE_430_length_10586_cov_6.817202_6_plen_206_part_00
MEEPHRIRADQLGHHPGKPPGEHEPLDGCVALGQVHRLQKVPDRRRRPARARPFVRPHRALAPHHLLHLVPDNCGVGGRLLPGAEARQQDVAELAEVVDLRLRQVVSLGERREVLRPKQRLAAIGGSHPWAPRRPIMAAPVFFFSAVGQRGARPCRGSRGRNSSGSGAASSARSWSRILRWIDHEYTMNHSEMQIHTSNIAIGGK